MCLSSFPREQGGNTRSASVDVPRTTMDPASAPYEMKRTVAVVGSGMAGLVTAFLLNRDSKYDVEVFEDVSLISCLMPSGLTDQFLRVHKPL